VILKIFFSLLIISTYIYSDDFDLYLLTEEEKKSIEKDPTKLEKFAENYLTGKSSSKMIAWKENGRTHLLRPDAKKAFDEMVKAYNEYRKKNIEFKNAPDIKPISAFRSYYDQLGIWNAKYTGERLMKKIPKQKILEMKPEERVKLILEYSSAPGTSRHHWGTDIDINSLDNIYFEAGDGKLLYQWLKENAHKFGFCQPYTSFEEQSQNGYFQARNYGEITYFQNTNEQVKGYFQENWHWSYAPVSQHLVQKWKELYERRNKDPISILGKIQGIEAISKEMPLVYVTAVNKGCDKVKNDYKNYINLSK